MSERYTLQFSEDAIEDLKKLDRKVSERVIKKMSWVAENAEDVKHDALTGEWSGYFRWRIGDYRAIYLLNEQGRLLIVAVVGHRRDVYED